MNGPLDTAVASPVLVGRDRERTALDLLIQRVREGSGATLLFSGEAGIGKSRLIAEARTRFTEPEPDAGMVLQGNCFEVDRDYPLAPITDLLSRFVLWHPDLARDLIGSDLAILLPNLAHPELTQAAPSGEHQPLPDKRRRQHAINTLFVRLARDRPLLVIIEDLHWADELTLELLPHLARTTREHAVLLLLSYRNDEVNPALRHMLAMLDRERVATEFVLEPLRRREVDLLLRAVFSQPHPIRPDFLDPIHALTDGNPFFIEEILRTLVAAGDIYYAEGHWKRKEAGELRIPRSVHDAVLRRVEDLSPESREVLSLAAVTGRYFGFRVIQELTGMDEDALLSCMRELIDSQLIYEESLDQFAFRHALTRQAIYSELLLRERRRLHREVAKAIERLGPEAIESRIADLSYHYDAAEDWERAYAYAIRAGDHAQALFAPQAAADHFTRALRAAEHLGFSVNPSLYRKRGAACTTLGRFVQAHSDFETMLELVRERGDRTLEWEALLDMGDLWTGYDYDRSGTYFRQAYDLARDMDDVGVIARSLLKLGNWQVNVERIDEATESLTAALEMFDKTGDQRGRAETMDLLGVIADASGDLSLMRQRYKQAEELYQAVGDRQGVATTQANIVVMAGAYNLFETISLAGGVSATEAEEAGDRVIRLTRNIDWRAGEAYVLTLLGVHYGSQGRYDRAFDLARNSLQIANEIDHLEWKTTGLFVIGSLYSDLLDYRQARRFFEESASVAKESGSTWMQGLTTGFLAANYVLEGNLEEAGTLLHGVDGDFPMQTMGSRMLWLARVKRDLALGAAEHALEIVERLFATASNFTSDSDIPALAKLRADCLLTMERTDEAEQSLSSARSGATTYGLQPLLWRVHLLLGRLYQETGRMPEAANEFDSARAIIGTLAASIPDETLRDHFLISALSLIPVHPEPSSGLTSREREVVALLATGLSNREIAEALFIGERTVETHVGNILAKLGFNSRAQVAAWMASSAADNQGD